MIQHIVIVGGGITGLATAYYLQSESQKRDLSVRFSVVESSDHWGGLIETVRKEGFVIEKGPDSFLERKNDATQLCLELGLEDELVHNQVGKSYICQDHQLYAVPKGSVMGVPTNLSTFLKTKLLSTEGKARGLEDLMLRPRLIREDQSVGDFFRHRFGDEMVDRIIEPLISGVYGSRIEDLSLEATYPQYPVLLQKYGSLIKAFKATNASNRSNKGIFQTLKSGLSTMVDRMIECLPADALITNLTLKRLIRTEKGYVLIFHNGQRMFAHSVVLAIPYLAARRVLHPYLDGRQFEQRKPTSVATIALAFDQGALEIPFEGTGFIVPRGSSLKMTACTWVHKKWPHTTPNGKELLRCFVGRPDEDQIVDASDDELVEAVFRDLHQIRGIRIYQEPAFAVVNRMKHVRPVYAVGHKKWVRRVLRQVERYFPGVHLVGSSYHGIGLPDCIKQGKETAEAVLSSVIKGKKYAIQ